MISKSAWLTRQAGPLQHPSKLRYQAVFLMGSGGSGKGFVVDKKYMKYFPGAGGATKVPTPGLTEGERSLTNLDFTSTLKALEGKFEDMGLELKLQDPSRMKLPFVLTDIRRLREGLPEIIPRSEWETVLPASVLRELEREESVIFAAPIHEVPSFWRVVNPDLYKEEIQGYDAKNPELVHEMSSVMSKAYFQATLETGDPMIVDGTGANLPKMKAQMELARSHGYKVSLVYVYVPLSVSLLRNALRSRNVSPSVVVQQWRAVFKNYPKLRASANTSHLIDNTNYSSDKNRWKREQDKVNAFMEKSTGLSFVEYVLQLPDGGRERASLKELGIKV